MRDRLHAIAKETFAKIGKKSNKLVAIVNDKSIEFDTLKNSRGAGKAPEAFPYWDIVREVAATYGLVVYTIESTWSNGKSATHPLLQAN